MPETQTVTDVPTENQTAMPSPSDVQGVDGSVVLQYLERILNVTDLGGRKICPTNHRVANWILRQLAGLARDQRLLTG